MYTTPIQELQDARDKRGLEQYRAKEHFGPIGLTLISILFVILVSFCGIYA